MPTQIENLCNLLLNQQLPDCTEANVLPINTIPNAQTLVSLLQGGNNIIRYLAQFDAIPREFIKKCDSKLDNNQSPNVQAVFKSLKDVLNCKDPVLSTQSPAYLYAQHLLKAYKQEGQYGSMLVGAYQLSKESFDVHHQMAKHLKMHPDQLRIVMLSYGGLDKFIENTKDALSLDGGELHEMSIKAKEERIELEKGVISQWRVHEFPLLIYDLSLKDIVIPDLQKNVDRGEPDSSYIAEKMKKFHEDFCDDLYSFTDPLSDEDNYTHTVSPELLNAYMSGRMSFGQIFIEHFGEDNIYQNMMAENFSKIINNRPLSSDMIWFALKNIAIDGKVTLSNRSRYEVSWRSMQKAYMDMIDAVNDKDYELASYLVEHNRVQDVDISGKNGLIIAIEKRDKKMQSILVQSSIDLNHQDKDGNTALMYAVQHDDMTMINDLVNKGVKTDLKNSEGRRAIDMAQENEKIKALQGGVEKENRPTHRQYKKAGPLSRARVMPKSKPPKKPGDANDLHNRL